MRLILYVAIALIASFHARALAAFPGAEGFGADTPGGRGGKVFIVTSLEDSGRGTLREACEAEGARFVVFAVSGNISLKGDLRIRNPFITIAGQTAPGDGICLKDGNLNIKETHDVVIRYIRVRAGDLPGKELDCISVSNCHHMVFDHVSTSFGIDETFSITHSNDCTVQWSFITESLNNSVHKKGAHGYGSLISGPDGGQSWHHNLYAHHKSRCPRGGSAEGESGIVLDFRNNVIYDWVFRSGYSGDAAVKINYIANYLKPGPSTPKENKAFAFWCGGVKTQIYAENNIHLGAPDAAKKDNSLLISPGGDFPKDVKIETCIEAAPFDAPPIHAVTAGEAFDTVLTSAGCSFPTRDALDARVAKEVREGKGHVIDSQKEVGGWPELKSAPAPVDTDKDGMPDAFETAHHFDPNANDAAGDADGNGYTNIEEYANSLPPHAG